MINIHKGPELKRSKPECSNGILVQFCRRGPTCKSMIYDPDKWQSDIPSLRSKEASIFLRERERERERERREKEIQQLFHFIMQQLQLMGQPKKAPKSSKNMGQPLPLMPSQDVFLPTTPHPMNRAGRWHLYFLLCYSMISVMAWPF